MADPDKPSQSLALGHDVASASVSCNKCGLCQEVCPVYQATGRESDVARGRNRLLTLLAAGSVPAGEVAELRASLDTCLGCRACVESCPSQVPTDRLILEARAELARLHGLAGPAKVALRRVLVSPRGFDRAVGFLRAYQTSGLSRLARGSGVLRPAGTLGRAEGLLPVLPPRSLRSTLRRTGRARPPGQPPAQGRPGSGSGRATDVEGGGRAAVYFLGCLTDCLFPGVGEAVLEVLERNGYDPIVADNVCCGLAHQVYGDTATALELARANVDILAAARAGMVVTDCASCAHTLIGYRELLAGDPRYSGPAAVLAARVRDVSQLLIEEGFEPPGTWLGESPPAHGRTCSRPTRVSYHDPCHLGRGLGVREAPRAILRAIPGLEFIETREAGWCCGGAGSYSLTHYEVSMSILHRKVASFRETGARLWATSCPACLMQLQYGLKEAGIEAAAVHPIELLRRAYQSPPLEALSCPCPLTGP